MTRHVLARWARTAARLAIRAGLVCLCSSLVTAGAAWLAVVHGDLVDVGRFVRPDDASIVVDRHGSPLREVRVSGADRRWVRLSEVSPHLVAAVLAVEDSRFRSHGGVDVRAVFRAVIFDLLPGGRLSGASTITQQTVKLVYGRPDGATSKGLEVLRALALERLLTKDEILEQYLNRVPFGDRIVCVGRAS